MKKFLLFTTMCLLFVVAKAQVSSMTDLFGEYTFTSNMTVTTDGEKFFKAGRFAAESDVVISKNDVYFAQVSGLAGAGGGVMGIQNFDADKKTFGTHNANSNSPWVASTIGMTTPDGANPYNGGYYLEFTYDANGDITIPDFALVRVGDYNATTATILAQFTNCKLTLKNKQVIVLEDMSGNWNFTATTFENDSTFPTQFKMDIVANNQELSEYSVDIMFEGYETVSINNATFNGDELVIPIDDSYISVDEKIALYTYMSPKRQGNIRFKKGSTNTTMTLSSGLRIAQETKTVEGNDTIIGIQGYSFGSAVKEVIVEASDFTGSYKVTSEKVTTTTSDVTYPKSFEIEVKPAADGSYYITKFFDKDVKNINNNVGIPAAISANDPTKLEISVGVDSRVMSLGNDKYVVLYDQSGSDKGKVSITMNSDGSLTMSDFVTYIYDGNKSTINALFQSNTIVLGDAPQPIDFKKSYTVKYDASNVDVKNAVIEFPTEWEIAFTEFSESKIAISSFLGCDISLINQGGFLIEVDADDIRTIKVDLSSGTRYLKAVVQGEQYLLVRNVDGESKGELVITIDEEGNVTISDFSVCLMDSESGDIIVVATYSSNTTATAVDAVEDEAAIAVQGGVISIAQEAAVEVYNLTGVCVYNGVTTEVSGLTRGIYIVKVGTTVRRVIL